LIPAEDHFDFINPEPKAVTTKSNETTWRSPARCEPFTLPIAMEMENESEPNQNGYKSRL